MSHIFAKAGPPSRVASLALEGATLWAEGTSIENMLPALTVEAWIRFAPGEEDEKVELFSFMETDFIVRVGGDQLGVIINGAPLVITSKKLHGARGSRPWVHLAFVLDLVDGNPLLRVYVEGEREGAFPLNDFPGMARGGSGEFMLSTWEDYGFRGEVAQLALWASARSDAEVKRDRIQIADDAARLIGNWTFEEDFGDGAVLEAAGSSQGAHLICKGVVPAQTSTLPDAAGVSVKLSKLPVRGTNGARERFLARVQQVATKRVAESQARADATMKAAQNARALRLAEAHRTALRQANNARFDEILHLHGGGIGALQRSGETIAVDGLETTLALFIEGSNDYRSFCCDRAALTDDLLTRLGNNRTPVIRVHRYVENGRDRLAVLTRGNTPVRGQGIVGQPLELSAVLSGEGQPAEWQLIDVIILPGYGGTLASGIFWAGPDPYPGLDGPLSFPLTRVEDALLSSGQGTALENKLSAEDGVPIRLYAFDHDGARKFLPACSKALSGTWNVRAGLSSEDLQSLYPAFGNDNLSRLRDFDSYHDGTEMRHTLLTRSVPNGDLPMGQCLPLGADWSVIRRGSGRPGGSKPLPLIEVPEKSVQPVATCMAVDDFRKCLFYITPGVRPTLYEIDLSGGETRQLGAMPKDVVAMSSDPYNGTLYLAHAGGELTYFSIDHSTEPGHFSETGLQARGNGWQIATHVPVTDEGIPSDRATLYFTNGHGTWRRSPLLPEVECIVAPEQAPDVMGLTVDTPSGMLYWVDRTLKLVRSATLEGHHIRNLYRAHDPGPGMMVDVVAVDGQAVMDGLKQDIYWTERITELTGDIPNLVAYWPCSEGHGRSLHDGLDVCHHGGFRGPHWCDELAPLPLPEQPEALLRVVGPLEFDFSDSVAFTRRDFTLLAWFRAGHGAPEGLDLLVKEQTLDGTSPQRFEIEPALVGGERVYEAPDYARLGWRHLAITGKIADSGELVLRFFVNGIERRDEARVPNWMDTAKIIGLGPHWPEAEALMTAPYVEDGVVEAADIPGLMRTIGPIKTTPDTEPLQTETQQWGDRLDAMPASQAATMMHGPFTFTTWLFHVPITGGTHDVFVLRGQDPDYPRISIDTKGGVSAVLSKQGQTVATGRAVIRAGKLAHLAVVFDGATLSIYVDGALAKAGSAGTGPSGPVPEILYLAHRQYDTRLFNPKIHARPLDPDAVGALAAPRHSLHALVRRDFGATWVEDAPPVLMPGRACLALRERDFGFSLPDLDVLNLLGSNVTLEFWFKRREITGLKRMMTLGHVAVDIDGNALRLGRDLDGSAHYVWDLPTERHVWRHMALRYAQASDRWDAFVDGVRLSPRGIAATGPFSNERRAVSIGGAPGQAITGRIAEIRLWAEARSDHQIATHRRSFDGSYLMRGPVDGSGRPEVVCDIATDGDLHLISRLSQAHEKHLMSARAHAEATRKAATLVSTAQTAAAQRKAKAHDDLDKAHQDAQDSIAAKAAEQKQTKADNAAKYAAAQKDKAAKVAAANAGARQRKDDAHAKADARKQEAHRKAAEMKSAANSKLNDAKVEERKRK